MTAPTAALLLDIADTERAARAALMAGDFEAGTALVSRLRRLAPRHPVALHLYAQCAVAVHDYTQAVEAARQAVAMVPTAAHLFTLGAAYAGLGEERRSARCFRDVLALDPDHLPAMMLLANGLRHAGQIDRARALEDRALEVEPANAAQLILRGAIRLHRGDYAHGLPDIERRIDAPWVDQGWMPPGIATVPRWDGGCVEQLVVFAEQGHGDAIMFARYLRLLGSAKHLTVVVHGPLVRLIERMRVADVVLPQAGYVAQPNIPHAPMTSLPALCRTVSVATIPAPAKFRVARRRHNRLRVGLCWAGRAGLIDDRDRSAPAGIFEPVRAVTGIEWVSLQRDDTPRGRDAAPRRLAAGEYPWITERLPASGDWLDTARFMADLDLVITIDSAVSHLAASLGIPTWCAIPTHLEWRHREGATMSDWYPDTMCYYRRQRTHDWRALVERIATDLVAWRDKRAVRG